MLIPEMSQFQNVSLLLLRIITGIIFISSGWSHFTRPAERAESIGMNRIFTFLLGVGEFAAGLFLALGIWTQPAAILLILVMLGAISFKIFRWRIGFYGKKSTGWHYDLFILLGALVILTTGGGKYILFA